MKKLYERSKNYKQENKTEKMYEWNYIHIQFEPSSDTLGFMELNTFKEFPSLSSSSSSKEIPYASDCCILL